MNPDKTVIVSDLDGVLVDTYIELQWFVWDKYGEWIPAAALDRYVLCEPIHEHLENAIAGRRLPSLKEFTAEIGKACWDNPDYYRRARPNPAYWQALRNWPGDLYFLTARPKCVKAATIEWLTRYGFTDRLPRSVRHDDKEYVHLYFAKNKRAVLEVLHNRHSGCEIVMIDDRPETIKDLVDLRKTCKRLRPILVEYPWSRIEGLDVEPVSLDRIADSINKGRKK